jgi:hypothetical protein
MDPPVPSAQPLRSESRSARILALELALAPATVIVL